MELLIFIHFVSASIWKWNALVVYFVFGIEESNVRREKNWYIIWYIFKETQLCCENSFYCAFITVKGDKNTIKAFNKSLL